jgi:hypothetical protein
LTALRVYFDGDRVGPMFARSVAREGARVRAAARGAAQDAAYDLEIRGRSDITQAGNFGSRWLDGFHVDVSEGGGSIRINAHEDVPYWRVFQFGATIAGKPMLWIPLSDTDAKGVFARDYPGGLFHVTRKSDGLELLGSKAAAADGDKRPMRYFGKESVTIPKKFHLIEIAQDVARKLRAYYLARFKK